MFKTSNFANTQSSNTYTNVCKSNDPLMAGMMHQVMTFTAIMIAMHILVMFVSILSRMNMAHDTNKLLEKIGDELRVSNSLRIIESGMCDCSDSECSDDNRTNSSDDNSNNSDNSNDDDSNIESEHETDFKTIGETAAEAINAVDEIKNLVNDATVSAMESKSEEDSIESAHSN
jgi:hypothetical protein